MLLVDIEGGSEIAAATAIRVACSPRSWPLIGSNLAGRLTEYAPATYPVRCQSLLPVGLAPPFRPGPLGHIRFTATPPPLCEGIVLF